MLQRAVDAPEIRAPDLNTIDKPHILKENEDDVVNENGLVPSMLVPSRHHSEGQHQRFQSLATESILEEGCSYLSQRDPRLRHLIEVHGLPRSLMVKQHGHFASLSKSIIFQQLATAAASKIYQRILSTCNCTDCLDVSSILAADMQSLRANGLSERKANYLKDLAIFFQSGRLTEDKINAMDDEKLLQELTKVKGIGPWSVHMFSMFHLGHPNVLPVGDLGVRRGMQILYGLKELPSPRLMESMAQPWEPYRSIGSYYMWRVEAPKDPSASRAIERRRSPKRRKG